LSEVHVVVDIATRADRTVYSGAQVCIPIAFAADAIYVVHAINLRQGLREALPTRSSRRNANVVTGSGRHM